MESGKAGLQVADNINEDQLGHLMKVKMLNLMTMMMMRRRKIKMTLKERDFSADGYWWSLGWSARARWIQDQVADSSAMSVNTYNVRNYKLFELGD